MIYFIADFMCNLGYPEIEFISIKNKIAHLMHLDTYIFTLGMIAVGEQLKNLYLFLLSIVVDICSQFMDECYFRICIINYKIHYVVLF